MSLLDDVPHTGHETGPRVPVTEEGPRIPTTESGPRVLATETPTDPHVLPGGGTVTDTPDPT